MDGEAFPLKVVLAFVTFLCVTEKLWVAKVDQSTTDQSPCNTAGGIGGIAIIASHLTTQP